MYDETLAKVRSPDGDTDLLAVLAGVPQGDMLAPLLFIIVLGYALRTTWSKTILAISEFLCGVAWRHVEACKHAAI